MSDITETPSPDLHTVVIRFAGDSGDGMQLTGDRFTIASAVFGNDLVSVPDYPAEIRAPAGTVAGVSAFQIHISDHDITTPGDAPNVLVAMNPAALKANVGDLAPGSTVIVNSDSFDERSLAKAEYGSDPLTDGSLSGFTVYEVPMTSLTLEAAKPSGAKSRDAERSKNFFALGLISWMYTRPVELTLNWIEQRFRSKPEVMAANTLAFKAGYNFGETAELFGAPYQVKPTVFAPGLYTNVSGNTALAWGLIAASQLARLPLFLASYPITPASDILHELSRHKHFGVRTVQAEDEIAAAGMALGAAFGGHLGVTTTSGPGMDLKAETLGLAVSLELPLLVVDVQRAGPSTGLPTKTEQSDLLMAMFGRHGEAPLPIVAAKAPAHCFDAALEAARIALKYRTPVILLTDGSLANGAEPWLLPAVEDLPDIGVDFATEPNWTAPDGSPQFLPYLRDPETLARPWAVPRHPGPRAPHRRPGEGRRDRRGQLRGGEPRAHGPHPGGQGGRHRPRHPAPGGRRPHGRRPRAGARLGVQLRLHRRRRGAGAPAGPARRPRPPGPPEPVPGQPGRGPGPLPEGAHPRDEPRAPRPAGARRVPLRRPLHHQGPGPALPVRRGGVGHPRPDGGQMTAPAGAGAPGFGEEAGLGPRREEDR
jgi:2-oxoglutarate/2-oxoacid ferredoxin oxidoreductase subunit alpha